MQLLTVDTLDIARQKIFSYLQKETLLIEEKLLLDSQNCVLAQDIYAPFAVPHFKRSTVDGYAICHKDSIGVTESLPSFLKIIGKVEMGQENTFSIKSGECVYVPTGGMLPQGADSMIMLEYTEKLTEDEIAIYQNVAYNAGVVNIGEDMEEKSLVLKKGTRLRPHEIGVLAALGITSVLVYAKPIVAIISLGDEILAPEQELTMGKVYDINSYGLYAQAKKFGFDVLSITRVCDDRNQIKNTIIKLMQLADIVVLSGGSSQGEKDFTASLLGELASSGVLTHGIAIKPGKPTITAYDEFSKTLLLGLPGHPVAAMLLFELLAQSVYNQLMDCKEENCIVAKMANNFPSADGKLTCQLVDLIIQNKEYIATPIFSKSGLISSLAKAQGYILVDMNTEGIKKDEQVLVHIL